jgi:protocatechuate 3,4-dioxygenase beta subunit
MTSRRHALNLFAAIVTVLLTLALVPAAHPVMSQEPAVGSAPASVYFIQLRPLPSDTPDGLRAAYERLRPTLLQLHAKGLLLDFEFLPAISSVRVVALEGAVDSLSTRPEVEQVKPQHRPPSRQPTLAEPAARPAPRERASTPEQTYSISGIVRDHAGTPVQDAWVSTAWDDPGYYVAWTDASGAYTLMVDAGTYHVSASKSGYADSDVQTVTVPPDASGIDLTFPETYTISGVVRDHAGTPVEGALVSTAWDDPSDAYDTTDATGAYTLIVIAGTYHVSASKSGYVDSDIQTVTVPPDASGIDLTFPATYTISGIVRDHAGTPVEGASVSTRWDDPSDAYASTDATGAYTLTVIAGTYHVSASKSGYADSNVQTVTVPPDATGIDLTFPETYTISGVVRDQDGNPVPDAFVYGGVAVGTTAADGSYTIAQESGEHYVSASKTGYQSPYSVLVPLPPAASTVDLLLLEEDGTIHGQIVDDQGTPLAGAFVWADNAVCDGGDSTLTAGDGTYSLSVPSGVYQVSASMDGHVPAAPEEVSVPSGLPGAQVDLVLERATHFIRGTVRDGAGQPLADASVDAVSCEASYSAQTDATGTYTLQVGSGTYSVYASKWHYTGGDDQVVSVPPDANGIDFTLTALTFYTITGRVTDSQGQPVEDAIVATSPNQDPTDATSWTDADGRYELEVLAGTYHITAGKQGYTQSAVQVVTVPPDRSGIDFSISPTGLDIRGTVRDTAGHPLPQAYVYSFLPDQTSSRITQVYYNGTYVRAMSTGTHEVYASATCHVRSEARNVTLPPSRTGIDFALTPRDQLISGIVTDQHGSPLCGAYVEAEPSSSTGRDSDSTERNGRYALQVPAGTYMVGASKSGYGSPPDRSITVPPYARGTNFILTASSNTIQGTVRDNKGVALAGAMVQASGTAGSVSVASGADGTYTITVLDGSWTVWASKAGYATFTAPRLVSVPPSRSGIDFLLVPQGEVHRIYLPLVLR